MYVKRLDVGLRVRAATAGGARRQQVVPGTEIEVHHRVPRLPGRVSARRGVDAPRARSHCRFALLFGHTIKKMRTYLVALFLSQPCDRTLQAAGLVLYAWNERWASDAW